MELNKIELKKISHDFNIVSSRIMRAKFDDYNLVDLMQQLNISRLLEAMES